MEMHRVNWRIFIVAWLAMVLLACGVLMWQHVMWSRTVSHLRSLSAQDVNAVAIYAGSSRATLIAARRGPDCHRGVFSSVRPDLRLLAES